MLSKSPHNVCLEAREFAAFPAPDWQEILILAENLGGVARSLGLQYGCKKHQPSPKPQNLNALSPHCPSKKGPSILEPQLSILTQVPGWRAGCESVGMRSWPCSPAITV